MTTTHPQQPPESPNAIFGDKEQRAREDKHNETVDEKREGKSSVWRRSKPKESSKKGDDDDDAHKYRVEPVSIWRLFRFATRFELALNLVGLVLTICAGAAMPLMTLFFAKLTKSFTEFGALSYLSQTSAESAPLLEEAKRKLKHDAGRMALWLTVLGIGVTVCTYGYMLIWNYTSELQARRIRAEYLKAVLRQEVEYLDNVGPGEIASRIQSDTLLVQLGLGEKIPIAVGYISTFITGFVLAYIRSPRMGGVLTSIFPVIIISGGIMDWAMQHYTTHALAMNAKASTLAEEAISSIRTVQAFSSAEQIGSKFDHLIELGRNIGNKNALVDGYALAVMFFAAYAAYALAFYYGGLLYQQGKADVDIVINVLMSILIGSFTLSMITPMAQAVAKAQAAAAKLFETIDRHSAINSADEGGLKPDPRSVVGHITLEGVSFTYPSRPTVPIIKNLSLNFEPCKTYALVGASGSGKSTVIQLIERFYDPIQGCVRLDGHDIRTLNVKWLRRQIGLVAQEPVLFNTTVRGNVEHGLIGSEWEHLPDARRLEMVKEACIKANAHDFISALPQGYDTNVGERGMLLSGGQKQRVAIARAIISNPRILLLDEATSALDGASERIVQDALDKASRGRTTIIIAHRLATIKDADRIFVMGGGVVLEGGTHESLIASGGAYAMLVNNQRVSQGSQDGGADDDTRFPTPSPEDETKEKAHKTDAASIRSGHGTLTLAEEKKEKRVPFSRLFLRLICISRSHWPWYSIGVLGSVAIGMSYPAIAILFGKSIAVFELPDKNAVRAALERMSLWYFIAALGAGVATFFQMTPFSNMGWNTASTLRKLSFRAIVRHDVQWFDQNEAGTITATLSDDPQKVQGLFGMTLGQIVGAIATLIGGIIIGLAYAPLLALIAIACIPLIFSVGYIRLRSVELKEDQARKTYAKSTVLATEAAGTIRTVASLTREESITDIYAEALLAAQNHSIRTAWAVQGLYAFSQGVSFFVVALVFWVGARWLADGRYGTAKFFITLEAVIFSAINAGSMFMYVPDASRAGNASRAIFNLLDNKPVVDALSADGLVVNPKNVQGRICFENVTFRYPTRPGVRVLQNLTLEVPAGKYVALVGPSGCGKSTTIQMIERFYDPLSGTVTLDGADIRSLNVSSYRSAIALVSQEPTLYTGNIRFNILLGALNSDSVTEEQLVRACKDANIYDFIMSLPAGFDTEVGGKGVQLSGGQKQRMAIARALIRNPKVLLLDEATAALDSASERAVQEALDRASEGRSVLAIAHRLSTIQNADIIYFISEGGVLEQGTHDELLAKRGAYFELVQMQSLSQM